MTGIVEEGHWIGAGILAGLGHAAEQAEGAHGLALAKILAVQDREADVSQGSRNPVAILMCDGQTADGRRIGEVAEHHRLTIRVRAGDPGATGDLGVG